MPKDDLEFLTLLPPFPKCWEYRCGPPCLAFVVQGMEPRASRMLSKHSTNSAASSAFAYYLFGGICEGNGHALVCSVYVSYMFT